MQNTEVCFVFFQAGLHFGAFRILFMRSGSKFAYDYRRGGRESVFFELGDGFHLSSWREGGRENLSTKQAQSVSFVKLTVI